MLRVKKLQAGFRLPDNTEYSGHRVFIREYSFLDNPKVPDSLKVGAQGRQRACGRHRGHLLACVWLCVWPYPYCCMSAPSAACLSASTAVLARTHAHPPPPQKSFVEIVPSQMPRAASLAADALVVSVEPAPRGYGQRVTVAAPLSDRELRQVVGRFKDVRVLHFPQPARTLSGFSTYATGEQYDVEIQKHVAYWCCRAPGDMRVRAS